MTPRRARYLRHRFPPAIISYAVWVYHRYCLSFRDVEDLLAERGILVSYETVRQWCRKFSPDYARRLKRRQGRLGDTWFLDEIFVTINGQRQYLWRAVDQDGDGRHVSRASAESHNVTSPRCTSARSYARQFATRYFVLYVGCTLDFMARSCAPGHHKASGSTVAYRSEAEEPCTNAATGRCGRHCQVNENSAGRSTR